MAIDLTALDRALIEAHAAHDTARMAALYHEAAQAFDDEGAVEAAAFYLTHAYVLSLDCGDDPAFIRFDEKRRGDHRALEQGA